MSANSVIIDGVQYAPLGSSQSIGIGITTYNRNDICKSTYEKIKALTPGAKIVIVDDASTTPVDIATFRFDTNVGIAKAKNKCLELLADCQHIFLFDDDAYPITENWYMPYIESPEPHLMYIFEDVAVGKKLNDSPVIYEDSQHVAYSGPRGVMLYIDRIVLDKVGGMDEAFGKWGWEHPSWSGRIHNAGLATWRFADVKGSEKLIHSMDEYGEVQRSVPTAERLRLIPQNEQLYKEKYHDSNYIEFREQRNVVLTCLFTSKVDPQRGTHMKADFSMVDTLYKSLAGRHMVLFTDQLDHPLCTKVDVSEQPYFQRWITYYQYLRDNPDIKYVWCVDATDVELLNEPFNLEPGKLYLGSENNVVGCKWMVDNHPSQLIQEFITANANKTLLNAGLVGGDRQTVMSFIHAIVKLYFDNKIEVAQAKDKDLGIGDMAALNYVAYTHFADRIVTGPAVHTLFKGNERNQHSMWRHK